MNTEIIFLTFIFYFAVSSLHFAELGQLNLLTKNLMKNENVAMDFLSSALEFNRELLTFCSIIQKAYRKDPILCYIL